MSTQPPDSFLESFFRGDPHNAIPYAEVDPSNAKNNRQLARWAHAFAQDGSTVLPARRAGEGGGSLEWYALARNDRDFRALCEEVQAFVGPSYSTFRPRASQLDPSNPVHSAVLDVSGGACARFIGRDRAIIQALDALHDTRERSPNRVAASHRAPGLLLSDFYLALVQQDRPTAESVLAELKDRSVLGVFNRHFLRIQLLAAFGEWSTLLGDEHKSGVPLGLVLGRRRPPAVTAALLQAVYHTEVARFEVEGDPKGAVDYVRTKVRPLYAPLLTSAHGIRSAGALKLLMAAAADPDGQDALLRRRILAQAESSGLATGFLLELAALVSDPQEQPPAERDPLRQARELAARQDFGEALSVLASVESSREAASLALRYAVELGTPEARSIADSLIENLDEEAWDALFTSRTATLLYNELFSEEPDRGAASAPSSWTEWLEGLTARAAEDGGSIQAPRPDLWPLGEEIADEEGRLRFHTALIAAATDPSLLVARALADVLPTMAAAIQRDTRYPREGLRETYQELLRGFGLLTRVGTSALVEYLSLLQGTLETAITPNEYTLLIQGGLSLWDTQPGASRMDWLLDLGETAAGAPYPQAAASTRTALVAHIAERLQKFYDRVDDGQKRLFHGLCAELDAMPVYEGLGFEPPSPPAEEEDPLARLADLNILFYAVPDWLRRRVRSLLEPHGVALDTNGDTVETEALRTSVRSADVVFVMTTHAAHAATACIDTHLEGRTRLFPSGRGPASVLRDLRDYASSL
ncbi:MAG: hypothetical protein SangKO_099900 [Sandaracinaceae bacterium]